MLRGINRWLEANRWAGDAVIASGLLVASLVAHSSADRAGLLMSAALILPVSARRSAPQLVLLAVILLCLLQLLVLPVPVFGDVAAPLAVHAVTAHVRDRRWGIGALAAGLVGALLGAVQWAGGRVGGDQFVLLFGAAAASIAAAYLLGARQRDQRERVQEQFATLQERNRLLAVERDQQAEVVAAAERARIARELHDIVAHSLSVIVVQANGAAAAVTAAPDSAAELAPRVLDTIADTSRDALTEMRRRVAVLRAGGAGEGAFDATATDVDFAPAPGVADLPGLVEQVSSAAVPVTFEQLGQQRQLPPTVDLTVYRVVQESLTNVIKHAGPAARAHVSLDVRPTQLQIDVVDDGRGSAAPGDRSGHGLVGMRERILLQGGTLTAGPRQGGGFAVHVTIPLLSDRTTSPSGPSS